MTFDDLKGSLQATTAAAATGSSAARHASSRLPSCCITMCCNLDVLQQLTAALPKPFHNTTRVRHSNPHNHGRKGKQSSPRRRRDTPASPQKRVRKGTSSSLRTLPIWPAPLHPRFRRATAATTPQGFPLSPTSSRCSESVSWSRSPLGNSAKAFCSPKAALRHPSTPRRPLPSSLAARLKPTCGTWPLPKAAA